jgi:hypothetical protein
VDIARCNRSAWRKWDDNTASRQTHYLNLLAGEALRGLEAEPAQAVNWCVAERHQFGIAEGSSPLQMIDRLIHELDELGLIGPSMT